MTEAVVDTTVAVRWFLEQNGHEDARALLDLHRAGQLEIVLPQDCLTELLSVLVKRKGHRLAATGLESLRENRIRVFRGDDALLDEALIASAEYGCAYYDAIPVAVARLLKAPLWSADRRAHSSVPGVVLVGEAC